MEDGVFGPAENLLLYADDECRRQIKINGSLGWQRIKKCSLRMECFKTTKLEADTSIVLPTKDRYTGKRRKNGSVKWWRVAAAAVLLDFEYGQAYRF